MTPIKLTAAQIAHFDEIAADRAAVDHTFNIAQTFHQNRTNELMRDNFKLWRDLAEIYSLDLNTCEYTIKAVNGSSCIVELGRMESAK